MNTLQPFTDRLFTAINTPQCDILTGAFYGQYTMTKLLLGLIGLYIIMKFVDKLIVDTIIEKIKNKFDKKQSIK